MINQEDTYNLLFEDTEAASRVHGTLSNIKTMLGKKSAKLPVQGNFNGTEDLLHCTAESLICKTAMRLLGFQDLADLIDALDVQAKPEIDSWSPGSRNEGGTQPRSASAKLFLTVVSNYMYCVTRW